MFNPLSIICNMLHAFLVASELGEFMLLIGVHGSDLLLELIVQVLQILFLNLMYSATVFIKTRQG